VVGDILQPTHLLLILVVALVVLGPKRLPEVGRSLGKGIKDFRSALTFDDNEREAFSMQGALDPQSFSSAPAAAPVPTPPPATATVAPTAPEAPATQPLEELAAPATVTQAPAAVAEAPVTPAQQS
jgi:sec-independent protein translocase protein TatA